MELFNDLVQFALAAAVIHLVLAFVAARRREVRAAQLEAELARAQLEKLRAQLDPHFLFNSLNAISEQIFQDAGAAERMIGRLGHLLRSRLHDSRHEVPLREELEGIELYLDMMRLRYPDRLTVEWKVDAGLLDAAVPSLILQPLVENALEHGVARRRGPCSIEVRGESSGRLLRLVVGDDGPGPARSMRDGVGLRLTRERLRTLYGEAGTLVVAPRGAEGGCRATLELPLRVLERSAVEEPAPRSAVAAS
jgi:LytS/YehU family sensor histidine kinase